MKVRVKPRFRNDGLKKRCGCPRRLWAKCPHPYHFGFHFNGHEYRFSLHKVANKPAGYFMSKSEAAAIRDRIRADIREGRLPGHGSVVPEAPTDPRLTFGDVADRYLRQYVWNPAQSTHRDQPVHAIMIAGSTAS